MANSLLKLNRYFPQNIRSFSPQSPRTHCIYTHTSIGTIIIGALLAFDTSVNNLNLYDYKVHPLSLRRLLLLLFPPIFPFTKKLPSSKVVGATRRATDFLKIFVFSINRAPNFAVVFQECKN